VRRQYVAIDLHHRRSVIVRMSESGEQLGAVRLENDPVAIASVSTAPGATVEVDGAPQANILWRWMGARAVPRLPCRFDCAATVASHRQPKPLAVPGFAERLGCCSN
jgi:hypothetical protein